MVECIEQLKAELEPFRVAEVPPFLYAHVVVEVARGTKIGKKPWSISKGERSRLRERCRIDPIINRLILRYRADTRYNCLLYTSISCAADRSNFRAERFGNLHCECTHTTRRAFNQNFAPWLNSSLVAKTLQGGAGCDWYRCRFLKRHVGRFQR